MVRSGRDSRRPGGAPDRGFHAPDLELVARAHVLARAVTELQDLVVELVQHQLG